MAKGDIKVFGLTLWKRKVPLWQRTLGIIMILVGVFVMYKYGYKASKSIADAGSTAVLKAA